MEPNDLNSASSKSDCTEDEEHGDFDLKTLNNESYNSKACEVADALSVSSPLFHSQLSLYHPFGIMFLKLPRPNFASI